MLTKKEGWLSLILKRTEPTFSVINRKRAECCKESIIDKKRFPSTKKFSIRREQLKKLIAFADKYSVGLRKMHSYSIICPYKTTDVEFMVFEIARMLGKPTKTKVYSLDSVYTEMILMFLEECEMRLVDKYRFTEIPETWSILDF